jgi:hypothetical protein
MGGAVGQVESAFNIDSLVLSVGQTFSTGTYHAFELGARPGFYLELSDPDEIVEFCLAHI